MSDQFNPHEHLESIQGKPYLNPRNAITWFYSENPRPHGRIITQIIQFEPVTVRAEVWIDDACIATGHASVDERSRGKGLKAFETSAIRRALANAGYGTDQALWWNFQQQRLAKEKVNQGNRRIAGESKSNPEAKDITQTTPLPAAHVRPATDVITFDASKVTAPVNEASIQMASVPELDNPRALTDDEKFDAVRTGKPEQSEINVFETQGVVINHNKKTNVRSYTFNNGSGVIVTEYTREKLRGVVSDETIGEFEKKTGMYSLDKPVRVHYQQKGSKYEAFKFEVAG